MLRLIINAVILIRHLERYRNLKKVCVSQYSYVIYTQTFSRFLYLSRCSESTVLLCFIIQNKYLVFNQFWHRAPKYHEFFLSDESNKMVFCYVDEMTF